jgi:prevent-host-death family protein
MTDESKDWELVDVDTLFEKFEELVDRASQGNEFVIARDNEPIAKLVPV